ncbi:MULTISPECIES: ParB/RepB/Spo0J family partition protein [Cellulomonas]|uniref:ParB/RepB/Spo0J family partition protein n=1 Tax=Cellulomonas denverensis TaxID=264297 RepID=A0A7X6KY30_9CELL|nr:MULTISPECIES: ParB/RepB/Spo0J family partition protein [Cellulomonas]NKY24301.1 ParB/RepB/Spo0J family partition protein [Cellulomonas denverensis]QZN87730.1 ParB/RepB/Spo0J family partition protein [Cellulomonas sp. C5510]GIG27274.1 hypothetical protein Cde04nite_35180 [Cellulomonas denverensis]
MTTSTTTRPVDTIAEALATEGAPAAEFAHLNPRDLVIEANVRGDESVDLNPGFIGSIRQYGVLMPILVVRQADGTLHVRAGKRRTLGAVAADAPTVPARIIDAGPGAERLVQQIIENDQRKDFTEAERVAGYAQMALDFGMSAGQIAGRLGRTRREVTNALRVAKSEPARQAVAAGLTIDQAATIAAFEDHPEIVERLTGIALNDPDDLAHEAQAERDDLATARAHAAARARMIEDLTGDGITILDAGPTSDDTQMRHLSHLRQDDGRTRINPEDHEACPGHAAYIGTPYWSDEPVTHYVCTDYQAYGHKIPSYEQHTITASGGGMTDEQKAERRRIIDGNKAWRSATTVRREWLATFAARKSAPKGAAAMLGYVVTHRADDLIRASREGHRMARDLLGLNAQAYGGRQAISDALDAAAPGRQQVIALTVALAAIEDATDDHTWRHPVSHVARYLTTIESWGYTLAAIEREAITGRQPTTDEPAPAAEPDVDEPDAGNDATLTDDEPQDVSDTDDLADGATDDLDLGEYEDQD